jgi:hypothetical protein
MKIQPKIAIISRIEKARRIVKTDTQKIRLKLIETLEEIYNIAERIARGEQQYQIIDGKPVRITLKMRRDWVKIAAYTAQVMNRIADSYDEREIDEFLAMLRREVDEITAKAGIHEARKHTLKRLKRQAWRGSRT